MPYGGWLMLKQCRVCGSKELEPVLDLGVQALTGIFPRRKEDNPESMPLRLVKCNDDGVHCGLLQLDETADLSKMYGQSYGYRSGLNKTMVAHLRGIVEKISKRMVLEKGDTVLDIGSNDGTLLAAYGEPWPQLIGVDPVGEKFKDYYPPGVQLIGDFFSAKQFEHYFGNRIKVITSIAMLYDLEDPMQFMREVREVLADDGMWVFEQSYMPAMIGNTSYDTVCHEHLEYYGLTQLQWMMNRTGFKAVDIEFNDSNGGSLLVFAVKDELPCVCEENKIAATLEWEMKWGFGKLSPYERFRQQVERSRDSLNALLDMVRGETILGYGASTKGNVILQYCDISVEQLPCIAEVNEDKFGAFTPGTLIPIVAEEEARARKPDYFLVLPWHFRKSIVEREQAFRDAGGTLVFPLPTLELV